MGTAALPIASITHTPSACILVLAGDIDMLTAPAVIKAGIGALTECPHDAKRILIDLAAVTFLDSTGIGALVRLRNEAQERGATVAAIGASDRVLHLFRITGLTEVFAGIEDRAGSDLRTS